MSRFDTYLSLLSCVILIIGCLFLSSINATEFRSGNEFLSPDLMSLQADNSSNPILLWVEKGRDIWANSCTQCHGKIENLANSATKFPRMQKNKTTGIVSLLNLEDQIQVCINRANRLKIDIEDDEVLSLSAALSILAKGQTIKLEVPRSETLRKQWQIHLDRGAKLYTTRVGRMNLACTHCHDSQIGKHLRADVISPAHPTGFPIYRQTWQNLGSIDRRLRACFSGVQAAIPAPGANELRDLELFLKVRAQGILWDGPSIRR